MRTLGIERPPFRPSIAVACPRCGAPAGAPCRPERTVAEVEKLCTMILRSARELRGEPKSMVFICGLAVAVAEELGQEETALSDPRDGCGAPRHAGD